MKTILACVDFSDVTPAVMDAAVSLSLGMNAKLYILHADTFSPITYMGDAMAMPMPMPMVTDIDAVRAESRKKLDDLATAASMRGLVVTPLLQEAAPIESILHEARRFGADFIVMGSHGHGAVYDLFIGSTTKAVLSKAECPVLIVPAHHRELVGAPSQMAADSTADVESMISPD